MGIKLGRDVFDRPTSRFKPRRPHRGQMEMWATDTHPDVSPEGLMGIRCSDVGRRPRTLESKPSEDKQVQNKLLFCSPAFCTVLILCWLVVSACTRILLLHSRT